MPPKDANGIANSEDPDKTAPVRDLHYTDILVRELRIIKVSQ